MDPEQAGAEALATYDVNKDGALAGPELDKCPGLKEASRRIDSDNDSRLTAAEIAALLRTYQQNALGLVSVYGTVNMDGKPVADATVRMVPEKFMGSAVQGAEGKTNAGGMFQPQTEGMDVPGVRCAVYRIEVSALNSSGHETIPAQFNRETTLGIEVGPGSPALNGIELELSTRK